MQGVFTDLFHNKSTIPALFTTIIIAIVIIFLSFSSLSEPFSLFSQQQQQKAYADGLTAENLPPATVGDREAGLFVKINPAILTSESQENAFLQFRLFDERNNETIQHVTYDISIRRANASEDSRPLLREFFHAHNGLLTIKIDPTEGQLQFFGTRDPFQNALLADPGGTVNVRGPILTDGGLYHIQISIFGIDNDRNIFLPENAPKFDSYLSIGDISHHNLTQQNSQNYNATLISYYDEIKDFNYDPQTQQISWTMPFEWNTIRIQDQNIFVHEEIKLPNSLLEEEFGSKSAATFNATVNDQPLVGRALAVDPFTSTNATIIHYLINKNQILELAENIGIRGSNNSGSNIVGASVPQQGRIDFMSFSLMPKVQANATQSTSSDLTTDTGGIHAAVSWEPKQLAADTESMIKINFSDAFSGEALNADVLYDFAILNSNGTQIFQKQNLTATNASDSQTVTFPSEEIYQIEVNVKGLVQQDGMAAAPDTTRSGIARGYVVVPEFTSGLTLSLLMGSLMVILLIVIRMNQKSTGKKNYFKV